MGTLPLGRVPPVSYGSQSLALARNVRWGRFRRGLGACPLSLLSVPAVHATNRFSFTTGTLSTNVCSRAFRQRWSGCRHMAGTTAVSPSLT
jgi:hypothetical protein